MNGAEMSCDDGETHCYLLDEGGYVIYSNQVSSEAEWELMGYLSNVKLGFEFYGASTNTACN